MGAVLVFYGFFIIRFIQIILSIRILWLIQVKLSSQLRLALHNLRFELCVFFLQISHLLIQLQNFRVA